MPFVVTWMDLEIIILTKRKTNIIGCHLYVESKKIIQMNLFTKQKQIHSLRKQIYGYQVGRMRVGIDWDLGIDMYTLLYLK